MCVYNSATWLPLCIQALGIVWAWMQRWFQQKWVYINMKNGLIQINEACTSLNLVNFESDV